MPDLHGHKLWVHVTYFQLAKYSVLFERIVICDGLTKLLIDVILEQCKVIASRALLLRTRWFYIVLVLPSPGTGQCNFCTIIVKILVAASSIIVIFSTRDKSPRHLA